MQASAKPNTTDRRDFVEIPSDQVRVAPSDAEITDLLRAAARQHSETEVRAALEADAASVPAVDATFRATAVNDDLPARGSSFGRRLMRAIAALLVAAGITGVALTWQTFGYAAKKTLITSLPKWAIVASLPLDKIGLGKESSPSDQPADATAAPAADAPAPAQNTADSGTPDNAAASAAAPSSDSAQQLQSMARDLASANQQIETLKASIAELKASQQQMARDFAKASDKLAEQNARPKTAAVAPPRPAVAPHKPAPVYSPTASYSPSPAAAPPPAYRPAPSSYAAQASAPPPPAAAQSNVPPPIPLQPQADPGVTSVPRPPMPVQ
ncbi:hypothetical protein [Bradyrhizobium sp.]|uniref:hypothetical protein n=1 Tax=Bradyrhizobium sp. TaxID=376 RepID=UPI002D399193|nr:hypothetical protein [Bradyrhizobium sp.]HZR72003.1 hypothetical protein [Bradyrhizobium sp.]